MITYDLSKTTGDGADANNGGFTYNVNVNVAKDTSNPAYTKYKHQHPKGATVENPTIVFNNKPVKLSGYNPSNKLAGIDVYFLRYNKSGKGKEKGLKGEPGGKEEGKGQGVLVGKDGQDTQQDKYPFLVVFKESETEAGPGSGETNKIFFGDPAGSDDLTQSVHWNKWEQLKLGKYITDPSMLLAMKLKQIARVWSELRVTGEVRLAAYNILKAIEGEHMVKFKSGNDNKYTVGHKQKINDEYYKHIFSTWTRDSNLGNNCLLRIDGTGESKCSEPIDDDGSMKSKIDQYYIDRVKRENYKVVTAYFDTKGSKTSGSKTSQKDNLLLVEFVDQKDETKYLKRRDEKGNWWSLREANYVSGQKSQYGSNLVKRLTEISSGTKGKQVTAFVLDKFNGEYKGVGEFKSNPGTAYNMYSHNLNRADPGERTVLLFGGTVTTIGTLKPSAVRPKSVKVYYLKALKCGLGNTGGEQENYPFLVALEGSGTRGRSNMRIYHFGDPELFGSFTGPNYWKQWQPFKKTNKEPEVEARLQKKLLQIESECDMLGSKQEDRRKRVYDILTHVDKGKGEEDAVVEDEEDDDSVPGGVDGSTVQEETEFEMEEQDYVKEVANRGSTMDGKGKDQNEAESANSSTDSVAKEDAGGTGSQDDKGFLQGGGSGYISGAGAHLLSHGHPGARASRPYAGSRGYSGTAGYPDNPGPVDSEVAEGLRAVGQPQGLDLMTHSDSMEAGAAGSCRTQSRIKKRSPPDCPGGNSGGGDSGINTNESQTPVIIKSASGVTVALAAVSTGGYLWHRMGTRTVRDMMAYF